ncbi:flavoprotein [Bythopirellula goksoeyrii]|uniref:Phosphopantothenoylcysteine decarboxylase n=1 Tax=Bythopirellula goksoeyrii TaxID=1400387 RepID=A0A5B9Q744_9BACT|nr:flavoprotein [Bythopirellula goksoeyrii]QEG34797.1 Phosphopantothenoylcysteine decarboxylase [Bythopirellula goksoeyrii]
MAHEIVVGVSGGIAAYKTAALVSDLVQSGVGVTVVMTRAAQKFVGPATFQALTGRRVLTRTFDRHDFPLGPHIELARQANLLCVAPATAHLMAQAAHGLADDLLSTLILSFTGPIVLAPAMNCEMWEKAAVQRNVEQLRSDGFHLVGPNEGWLSCRQKGMGRMAEPAEIAAAVRKLLQT